MVVTKVIFPRTRPRCQPSHAQSNIVAATFAISERSVSFKLVLGSSVELKATVVLRNFLTNFARGQLLKRLNQQFAELSCSSTFPSEFKIHCNMGCASMNFGDAVFEQGSTVCTDSCLYRNRLFVTSHQFFAPRLAQQFRYALFSSVGL